MTAPINYEQAISSLSPENKRILWDKYKDLNFSNKTLYAMIYYEAKKHKYL